MLVIDSHKCSGDPQWRVNYDVLLMPSPKYSVRSLVKGRQRSRTAKNGDTWQILVTFHISLIEISNIVFLLAASTRLHHRR